MISFSISSLHPSSVDIQIVSPARFTVHCFALDVSTVGSKVEYLTYSELLMGCLFLCMNSVQL